MRHMKKFESFLDKAGDKMAKFIFGEDEEVPNIDGVEKKYTEKDVFELTQESYQVGYKGGEGGGKDFLGMDILKATDVKNPLIMNIHKNWFKKKFNK